MKKFYSDEINVTLWIYKEVAILKKGQSFGELALITFKPRAATIQCLGDEDEDNSTDLAVMSKATYEKMMGKAIKRKLRDQVDFLKQFRILNHLNEAALQRLIYYLKEIKTERGKIIYRHG